MRGEREGERERERGEGEREGEREKEGRKRKGRKREGGNKIHVKLANLAMSVEAPYAHMQNLTP